MKKIYLLIFVILCSIGLHAQDSIPKISLFLNIGQSIPIGSYSASSNSSNPVAIGQTSSFAKSFNCGFDYYFMHKLGVSLGLSSSRFDLDKMSFEKSHTDNLKYSDSYLRKHLSARLYAGLTTRFIFNKLSIDPRLNIGFTSFNFEYSDFYETNTEGDIFKTISYKYETSIFMSLNGGINATYELIDYEDIRLGLQLFSEISYQRPEVKYEKIESDKNNRTINKIDKSYKQNLMFVYYGIGLVLKI
jgi:hypothetical protein